MTRAASIVSIVAHIVYIANTYVTFGQPLANAMLPYSMFALWTSLAAAAISFLPGYIRYWKYVVFTECVCLMVAWTGADLLSGQQVVEAFGLAALMVATCVLCPWEPKWQSLLALGSLLAFAVNTAFVRPISRDLGYFWTDLLAIIGLTLASSRLWSRWRHALQQSEAKLRKVFDATPDNIYINSLVDGRFIEFNREFSSTGCHNELISGSARPHRIWAKPEQSAEFAQRLQAHGVVQNFEADFRQHDGTVVPCLISGAVVEVDNEPCAVTIARDIRELVAARAAALAASRAKSEFLSSMSHEIRTPMNAILGMADLLAETNLSEEQARYVRTMINNGNALLDLINGILDLAKVESGKLQLEQTEFDLADLVELVAETFGVRAHEKGLELLFRIMPEVPASLVGDPLRLRQILVNLLGNALKFTEHGEVVLTVENDGEGNGLVALRFSVRDTGIGIAPDQLDRIFQTFTQADSSTTRKFGGSGLGLAIARRLAELMNGRICAESEMTRGSTFHFTACFAVGQGEPANAPRLDLEGVRMLIVDDNATNRLILRETLMRRGAEVREAASGSDALKEVGRARDLGEPYRLILLDCRMPGMDGFEVAEQLKRQSAGSQPTILMLTSDDMTHKLGRVREIGIDAYVVKPVKRADLFKAIALLLGQSNQAEPRCLTASTRSGPDDARGLKILLVEDSPDNRLLIAAYLKNLPYALDCAENGAVAVEKFRRDAYDLVLMDMQMPVMDGLAATQRMRQEEREQGRKPTLIVALTASALEQDVRRSLEAGCTAHLSKPVKKTALLSMIRELTAGRPTRGNGRDTAEQST